MRKFSILSVLALVLCSLVHAATNIKADPDHETGVYDPGQNVTWAIAIDIDKKPATGKAAYRVLLGGLEEIAKGDLDLADGKASVTSVRKDPGALLLEIKFKAPGDAKETIGRGGAVFAPDKIVPSSTAPDDFDKFWADKIAMLKAIPENVQITPVEAGVPGIEYFKITMDNINGTKIHGQLAKPKDGKNLPALLQVQYAGVYPLQRDWVINPAKQGWLAFNIIAHDLPIDESPEFYKKLADTTLNDYPGINCDDRETSYFLRMFLSCYRAADYLTERPDWNKKTLLVEGGSQGGYQTLVTAGLHHAVTAYAASVPAGCDHNGKAAHRAAGWPYWFTHKKDPAKMLEASRYFDSVNFAARIKAPGLIGLGLVDVTCPPEGIYAAVNQIKPEKKVVIMPNAGHTTNHNKYYAAYNAFLNEQKGK